MLRRMLPVTGRLHSWRRFEKVDALRNITPVNELHLGASADNVEKIHQLWEQLPEWKFCPILRILSIFFTYLFVFKPLLFQVLNFVMK